MLRRQVALYGLLTPYLLGTLLLIVIPALIAFGLAFTNYDSMTPITWAGLDNFLFLLGYKAFLIAARNTVGFIVVAVPLRILAMLGLALLMSQPRPGTRIFRIAIFLPTVIPDIAQALLWMWIFNPLYGPINTILRALGLPAPKWMVDKTTILWLVLIMSLFMIGEGFVVLLAGLHEIPRDYYQAAQVDGGNRWQTFRYITLPLLRPWLVLLTFRDIVVGAQSVFTPAFLMMGPGRDFSSWYLPQMIYEEAFGRLRIGVASAVMVTWLFLAGALIYLSYRFIRGWGYADEL